jgi:hypothetical protein
MQKSGAVSKVKELLDTEVGKTHAQLKTELFGLSDNQIAMALGYLKRRGLVDIDVVPRVHNFGRKTIQSYRLKCQPEH